MNDNTVKLTPEQATALESICASSVANSCIIPSPAIVFSPEYKELLAAEICQVIRDELEVKIDLNFDEKQQQLRTSVRVRLRTDGPGKWACIDHAHTKIRITSF